MPFEEKKLESLQKGCSRGGLQLHWADPSNHPDNAVLSVRARFQWFLPDETRLRDSIRAGSLANRVHTVIYALKYPDN